MHTEKREDPLVELGYEVRDINISKVRLAVNIFFGFAFISGLLGYGIFWLMDPVARNGVPAEKYERRLPQSPSPLLQTDVTAKTDIMQLRQKEDESLLGAPSQNPDGSYRIPIDAAMKMTVGELKAPQIQGDASVPATPSSPPAQPISNSTGGQKQ